MNPLPPPPPGLDFGRIFVLPPPPLQSHLDLFVYLLLLPFELIATHAGIAAAVGAVGAAVGGLFQLLVLVFAVAALVALLLVLLIGLGVGGMLAAVVTAYVTRRRAAGL